MLSSPRLRSKKTSIGCIAISGFAVAWGLHSPWVQAASPAVPHSSPQSSAPQEQARPVASHASPPRALLDRYCVTCHNQRLKTANLTLDTVDVDLVAEGAEVWEKVVAKLRIGDMPPAGAPRPDKASLEGFVTRLETELDRAAAANPDAGRRGAHRLNRTEYVNAIRDLLELEIDGRSLLPADAVGYGFDNMADVLAVNPGLLERYMIVAQKISRLAVGDPTVRTEVESYKISTLFRQEDRAGEDLAFGTRGGIAVRHHFPVDGEYSFGVTMQRTVGTNIRGVSEPNILEVRLDGRLLQRFTVFCDPRKITTNIYDDECGQSADEKLQVRVPVKAGEHLVAAAFLKNPWMKEGPVPDRLPVGFYAYQIGADVQMAIESLNVGGPYSTSGPGESASRRKIFVCRPTGAQDEEACAKTILSTLARRAYRRPVGNDDLQTLLKFYQEGRPRGFDAGIQLALQRILIDPEFLFRTERQPATVKAGTSYRLSDLELASRLSFFLWSSLPDDELLDVAAQGKLKEPAVLEQQVKRMFADEKASALVTNFGGQWLFLRNLREVAPDPKEYPDFDDNLREAMQRETELFFSDQLRGDRPLADMLRANYTFVNQRLAEHYGMPKVYGSHFRRVTLPDDRRAGILGQAGILVATNTYPNRTSPVKRGVWLLENILGSPPPAPPPNVPPFPEEQTGKVLTVRERTENHRKNPVCAACHAKIDPLGFAMENFDAIGQWRDRDREAGVPIDASGQLPDGSKFNGPVELRNLMVGREAAFAGTVTKKLLTYALGRGVEYYDMPAVRKVMRDAAPSEYRWSAIVMGIVQSVPFQMRRSES